MLLFDSALAAFDKTHSYPAFLTKTNMVLSHLDRNIRIKGTPFLRQQTFKAW